MQTTQEQLDALKSQNLVLQEQLNHLTELFHKNNFETFQYNIKQQQHADGVHFSFGKTYGTKIGTATTEKIGFFNVTPIVQPSAITAPVGGGVVDAESRTAINSIRTVLSLLGLTA